MQILTAAEMRDADHLTSERYGVSFLELMENAGRSVSRFVLEEFPSSRKILVICGRGNNGGDGFVAARHLYEAGKKISVLLLGSSEKLSGDAQEMFDCLSVPVLEVESEAELAAHRTLFRDADLVVDAVLGTGFKPPLRGMASTVRDWLREAKAAIVAVDLPSGWDADSKESASPEAFPSDAVVTFTAPKLAHIFGNLTRRPSQPVVVAPIGSPPEAVNSTTQLFWAGNSKAIADVPRRPDSNKGQFGHVLLVGGSWGKSGAPAMSSLAALRTGAGLVTAAVPTSILALVAGITPELMTSPLEEGTQGEIALRNLDPEKLDSLFERKTVMALGPGLSQAGEAPEVARKLIASSPVSMVIDADGLNALAGHLELLPKGGGRTVVLTPHPGEMARLGGLSVKEVQANREEIARDFARKHSVTLVLKGWRTLVAHPDGRIAVNTTGNPGMAKGGSGDILTGIVAAMLAQYPDRPAEAVEAAVYLHGLSADFALLEQNEHTLLATDTIAHLFRAFRFQPRDHHGYVWIQGLPRL